MGKLVDRRIDEQKDKEIKKHNKSKARKFLQILMVLFIMLLIFAAGVFGYGYYTLHKMNTNSKVVSKPVPSTKPVNILLLGVDAGDYTNYTKNNPSRSDTMMLVRYNPKSNSASILSLPRDTKITLNGHSEKLNAAHMSGAANTIKTIEKLLNIDINYYFEINYEGFRECIDALGGVDIKIPRDMDYDAWKISIHFKKGEIVHMNGEKAEEFVRWRKNNDGGGYAMGDLGRISTQQDFIMEAIKKLKTPLGLLKIPALITTVSKYVETNIPPETLLEYAYKAKSMKPEMVQKEILPGEAKYIGAASFYVWNNDLNDKFIQRFRGIEPQVTLENSNTNANTNTNADTNTNNSNALPSNKEANKNNSIDNSVPASNTTGNNSVESNDTSTNNIDVSTNITTDKKNMQVIILNSTGKHGLAALYKSKFEKLGYSVTQTANYAYKKYSYTIINDYSKQGYGAVLYKDMNFGKIVKKQNKKPLADLVVILGTDSIK
jgi:polyisoprenyl-teichoic acid--peptidoglycan teichoic acid transferase